MRPSPERIASVVHPSLTRVSATKQAAVATRAIADIRIGKRHRRDLGDVNELAASIAAVGLMHPVVIEPDGTLIAGQRRLEAYKLLGRTEIPVTVVALDNIVRGEFAENTVRKDFTLSEAVAIKQALEPVEKAAAKTRMLAGKPSGKLPKGRAGDKAAKATGRARRTLEKAEAVVAAAEAEPEKFGKLKEVMDKTGRANGLYRRLKNIKLAEAIRAEPSSLPGNGPYRAGLVDIPWAYEPDSENAPQRGVLPYPTLSIEQACALNVGAILHPDCVVGMWVTNFVLACGLHVPVLQAWGLERKTVITWPKDRIGRGHYAKRQTEHLVIAVRGEPIITLTDQTTLLRAEIDPATGKPKPFHLVQKNAHSAKPIEAYTYFESLYPAPRYFDLFSRYQHNDKWDCHGNEAQVAADLKVASARSKP